MLVTYFWYCLSAFQITFHNMLFVWFVYALYRIFKVKYAPYSSLMVGAYGFVHSLYNGCPLADMQNFISSRIGVELSSNEFAYGIFGEYTTIARIAIGSFSLILLYASFKQWNKAQKPVHFEYIFNPKLHFEYSKIAHI